MGRNVDGARNGRGCVPDHIYRGVSDWEDGVMRYRICKNEAPHKDDWWTVEYEMLHFHGHLWWAKTSMVWNTVEVLDPKFLETFVGAPWITKKFASEADAQAWINEAKRPRTHVCGEPQ